MIPAAAHPRADTSGAQRQTPDTDPGGIADRVTYHNPDNGWSVLRVLPFDNPHQQETVTVHQTKVFAGATMEFHGSWTVHPKFGRQFKATKAIERKPATTAALEKYLGSGLIKDVAAGAVFIASIFAVIIALIIYIPKMV